MSHRQLDLFADYNRDQPCPDQSPTSGVAAEAIEQRAETLHRAVATTKDFEANHSKPAAREPGDDDPGEQNT